MADKLTPDKVQGAGPWIDLPSAVTFLRSLVVGLREPAPAAMQVDLNELITWLMRVGLGPIAYQRYRESWPALGERLRADHYITAMNNRLHMERLGRLAGLFADRQIRFVMLKGVALSQSVYQAHVRPMSDIDLWLRADDMPVAVKSMSDSGFRLLSKADRPLNLQVLSNGELQFASPDGALVELHWSPFSGWWLHRTANIDDEALWQRIEPLRQPTENERQGDDAVGQLRLAHTLSAEDTILHLATHLAVNHQFSMWGIRSVVDVAMVLQHATIDWQQLVHRAQDWRLSTVLWTVLNLHEQLVGNGDLTPVLHALRPPRWKIALLARFVSPNLLLAAEDLRDGRARYVLLLLLVDRNRDAVRLILRTLWPERAWLEARYGEGRVSRRQHLWNVLRHGTV